MFQMRDTRSQQQMKIATTPQALIIALRSVVVRIVDNQQARFVQIHQSGE